MNITIISVGSIKEPYLKSGISEYTKRLQPYVKLNIIEVADESTKAAGSPAMAEKIKQLEADRILKSIPAGSYVIALAIDGKAFSSEALSAYISELKLNGVSHICLIIGGSLGLHSSVLQAARLKLSFSSLTFPHQLMRLILLEQLYRSCRIENNEPYHK